MKKVLLLIILISRLTVVSADDGYQRNPGIDVLNYTFRISINDTSDLINGEAVITFIFKDLPSVLEFDFKNKGPDGKGMVIDSVRLNIPDSDWSHQLNKIKIIPGSEIAPGKTGILKVAYHGIPADGLVISENKFGNRSFFSDHWPDRARNYIPCIDHPYEKATVDFVITAPSHYEVVANGCLVEESHIGGDMKMTHWKEETPVAVKVMAFAAAEFDYRLSGTINNIPVWTYVFKENREEGFNDYSIAVKPVKLFSELIGDYSYEKLANVQSKTIFGGLENAGCIFYSENSVTGKGKAEGLIAHEVAHQWFGNSVTESDWHHIWLSEGFATYMTSVYMEKNYGSERLVSEMESDREQVLRYYLKSPRPVIDTTITNPMRLLNVNSYQKGSWVLHMLRNSMEDDIFWKAIRIYYDTYRNKNASTDDFMKIMEEVSGKELERFFFQWLYQPGQPELKITSRAMEGRGMSEITVEQKQDYLYTFNLELLIDSQEGGKVRKNIEISERITKLTLETDEINSVIPDPDAKLLFRQVFD